MNLVEQLLSIDSKKADELKESTYKSKRLQELLGTEEAVEIKIKEIPVRRLRRLAAFSNDSKGNTDLVKSYDADCLVVAEGVFEPRLNDEKLLAHYGVPSAKELVAKLFKGEASNIASSIIALGEVEANEEDIKN